MSETMEISAKKAAYLERRKHLIALSEAVRPNVGEDGEFGTVNEALKALYEEDGHEELNTIHGWNEQGYRVKKGEKALLVWGSPRRTQQGEDDEDKSTKFWPVCYLFSNLQVKEAK